MFGFGKKLDKGAWAEAIYGKKLKDPSQVSEAELSAMTDGMLMQHQRIIMDSLQIIKNTKNADTKQGRIDLCRKHLDQMEELKPFANSKQLALIKECEDKVKTGTR